VLGYFGRGDRLEGSGDASWGGTYTNREDVAGFFALLSEYFDDFEVHPTSCWQRPDRVVDIGVIRGRGKLNDEPFEIRYCLIWK